MYANCIPRAWIVEPERSEDHPETAKSPSQPYEDDTVPYTKMCIPGDM